jgi:Spy/CpxP family protein refolding chaperone
MDWVRQYKLKNWLIAVLVVLNLLTVSILWIQTAKTNEPQRKEQGPRSSESVQLMAKALDLSKEQMNHLNNIRTGLLDQLKEKNDRLNEKKRELAEELFKTNPDTSSAKRTTEEIGELQSKVELLRFQHFYELLALCTPEQKEKLRPIIVEVIGRKPPKNEPQAIKQIRGGQEEKVPRDSNLNESPGDQPQDLRDGKPKPPSVHEKAAKYAEQLNLSDEQRQKVQDVLLKSKQKGEELRTRAHPDRNEIETERERIRKEEDESIQKILNEDQKKEFSRMMSKRRK